MTTAIPTNVSPFVRNVTDIEQQNFEIISERSGSRLQKTSPIELYTTIQHTITLSKNETISEGNKKRIRDFFINLSEVPQEHLPWHKELSSQMLLQRILSPDLDRLIELESTYPDLESNEDHQLEVALAKAKLSANLGFGVHSAGGGENGAKIIKSFEGDPLLVFKPHQKIKWYEFGKILKQFFGQARLLSSAKGAQELAEVAANLLDKTFGFRITPASKACQIGGDEGVCLLFLKDYKQGKDIIDELENKTNYVDLEKILFQKMAIYDFLTGNMDCHDENWFVRMVNGCISEIRVIDHGNAFIERNPGEWGLKGNQYLWGRLKIAKEEFQPEVIEFINNMKEEHFEVFIQTVRPNFLNRGMENLLQQRFRILKERIALTQDIHTPSDLAQLRTDMKMGLLEKGPKFLEKHESDFVVVDIVR